MWNLKYGTNELIHKTDRLTVIENRLMVAMGEKSGGGKDGRPGLADTNYYT